MNRNNSLEVFDTFAKGAKKVSKTSSSNCVIYTRVSSKEQADNNQSLDTQLKYCQLFADKNSYNTLGSFGGTYESAKNDERKEFNKMLSFVKRSKEKIDYIVVYHVDRFSRSGANAIYITSELKKQGISVISVTQPTDSNTASGSLQQNIQFIFSQYDNDTRREKCMAGTRERLLQGYWVGPAPIGYEQFRKGKEQHITVTDKGKLLKKAFVWKAEQGLTNTEILIRLKSLGLTITKQRISDIFRNPFYCGLVVHKSLEGEVVEGKHEKLISKELFLKANDVLTSAWHKSKHNKDNPNIPLKRFVRCSKCGSPFAGYIVKKKNLHYYKCNTTGCHCNSSAKFMHGLFENLLDRYTLKIDEDKISLFKDILTEVFYEMNKSSAENGVALAKQIQEVDDKLELLQEKFILGDLDKTVYEKFNQKYKEEKALINDQLSKSGINLSNLSNYIETAIIFACKINKMWELGDYQLKEKLQYAMFPDGILYDKENSAYLTPRVNYVIELISSLSTKFLETKKRQETINSVLSPLVERKGFEPSKQLPVYTLSRRAPSTTRTPLYLQ